MKKEFRKYNLKRGLGFWEVTLSGVGIIFGAGIYVLIGKAAGLAGNFVWFSFIFAAIVAAFSGLSYAELSSMYPKAGAEYIYTEKAFNKRLAFIIGFLIILSGTIGGAAVALGFGGYFSAIFNTPIVLTAIFLVVLLSLINFIGIKQSAGIAVLFTLIESAGLVLIILIGAPHIGSVNYFQFSPLGMTGVFSAAALIFFAYLGFEEMVKLSEETKNPTHVIPKALVVAMVITTIVYILVAVASVSVMGWEALSVSKAPMADVAATAFGPKAFFTLSIIALFATANTALLMLLASSRILYGMAAEKRNVMPNILSRVHGFTRTPYYAISLIMMVSAIFVLIGKIDVVADLTNFTAFLTFIVINASVIWLRYKEPKASRPFKTPFHIGKFPILPLFGIIASGFMLLNIGFWILVIGAVFTATGFVIYEVLKQ